MSDNDDDRAKKDNAGKEHKPEHAQDNENAPRGSSGIGRTFGPSLGLGGSRQRQANTQAAEQTAPERKEPKQNQGKTPERHHDPANDPRPVFHETEDKATNDFYKKTHRMIPKDAPERGVSQEGPRVSQSDFAKAFRQVSAKTQSMQRSRGIDHD